MTPEQLADVRSWVASQEDYASPRLNWCLEHIDQQAAEISRLREELRDSDVTFDFQEWAANNIGFPSVLDEDYDRKAKEWLDTACGIVEERDCLRSTLAEASRQVGEMSVLDHPYKRSQQI